MAEIELVCPECGGKIEERGTIRFYGEGKAIEKEDGSREWDNTLSTWRAPVETLVLDGDDGGDEAGPYYCTECDAGGFPIWELGREGQPTRQERMLAGPRCPACSSADRVTRGQRVAVRGGLGALTSCTHAWHDHVPAPA